ncbi:hypothetical protein JB92DRAFT_3099031 [Gautieria morchelliformis]|nr:hypothetical protein JB92DRAFT_3099031 [Gautieria morchelliformis]
MTTNPETHNDMHATLQDWHNQSMLHKYAGGPDPGLAPTGYDTWLGGQSFRVANKAYCNTDDSLSEVSATFSGLESMLQFSVISPSVATSPENQQYTAPSGVMAAGYYGTHLPRKPLGSTTPSLHTPSHKYASYDVPQPPGEQPYRTDYFLERYAMIGLYDHLQ